MWIEGRIGLDLKVSIEGLRKLEKKVFGPRHHKRDFYRYLEAVFRLYSQWKAGGVSKKRAAQVASMYEVKLRTNTHPLRVIIETSSEQNADVKSRWTRALQYAWKRRHEIDEVGFVQFLEGNGGVRGCADKIAEINPKKADTATFKAA